MIILKRILVLIVFYNLFSFNINAEDKYTIILKNIKVTNGEKGGNSCVFFDGEVSGSITENDSITLKSVSTPNLEFNDHPANNQSMSKFIVRQYNSDYSLCNSSGTIINDFKIQKNAFIFSPITQYIRIAELSKKLNIGDNLLLSFYFQVNGDDHIFSGVAKVETYESILQKVSDEALENAKKMGLSSDDGGALNDLKFGGGTKLP